jgi:septal ring factor EnvC (AmiA/AmiB activator)
MNVKEKLNQIRTLLSEAKPVEAEVTVEAAAITAEEIVNAPVVFELTQEQYEAVEARIASIEESNASISAQFAAVKAENEAYKATFAKHGEVVNQLLELVSKLSEQPEAAPVEQVTTGFSRFNKQEKEARFSRLADSVKAMKELTIKN